VVTDPTNGADRLHLILSADESAWITIEMFSHTGNGYPTIGMFIFDATSEAFVNDIYGPPVEVVMRQVSGDTASMLVRFEEAGTLYWFVVEIRPIAGVAVIEYGTWAPVTIEGGILSAQQHILLDATPVLTMLPTSDVTAAVAGRA
jgi:hypothetical protein